MSIKPGKLFFVICSLNGPFGVLYTYIKYLKKSTGLSIVIAAAIRRDYSKSAK